MENKIYQAITNAMAEITPIAKAKKNEQQGFMFRGIDQVMNELNPILAKHKIFIYPEVIHSERSERQTGNNKTLLYSILTIKYHFATEDGSEICTTVIGEGMDSGDKASNKAMAVAFKYACLQMFCIPTEDMTDPDAHTPPPSTPKDQAPQEQKPTPATPPPSNKPKCPKCGKDLMKSKPEYGGGWICWKKNGGCGAVFSDDDMTDKNADLQSLKREAGELIKQLPEDQREVWTNSCNNANEATLKEIIKDVKKDLSQLQTGSQLAQAAQNNPVEQLDIF